MNSVISIEGLNRLARNIENEFNHVNAGGCGVISYLVYEKLVDVCDNLRIVYLYSPWLDPRQDITSLCETNGSNIKLTDLHDNGYGCGHALVLFDFEGETYSFETSEGVKPFKEHLDIGFWGTEYIEIPYDSAKAMAENQQGWNTLFDRLQIPRIKKTISMSELAEQAA